jgi:hypothetical protein
MQTYQETESLKPLLEKADQEGAVYIRRSNGKVFVLKPEDLNSEEPARSPLDVGSVKLNMTTEEIVEFIHEGRGNDRW